ncbi:MAG: ATP-dependent Clp protease adapter ClpS [bacterium]|nr:ATP-dependent Clp protease adapter ClpS [bacterium]
MGREPDVADVIESDTRSKTRLKKPQLYKVVLFNDDYTTMDFVVDILMTVFNKQAAEATKIMLDVHRKGAGVCGVYTYDIATTKINQVHTQAKLGEFPLRCGMEPV